MHRCSISEASFSGILCECQFEVQRMSVSDTVLVLNQTMAEAEVTLRRAAPPQQNNNDESKRNSKRLTLEKGRGMAFFTSSNLGRECIPRVSLDHGNTFIK